MFFEVKYILSVYKLLLEDIISVLSALIAPVGCFSQNNGGQREGLLEVKFSASDKVVEESHEAASENNTCLIATLEEV